jgi:hypothetical protein
MNEKGRGCQLPSSSGKFPSRDRPPSYPPFLVFYTCLFLEVPTLVPVLPGLEVQEETNEESLRNWLMLPHGCGIPSEPSQPLSADWRRWEPSSQPEAEGTTVEWFGLNSSPENSTRPKQTPAVTIVPDGPRVKATPWSWKLCRVFNFFPWDHLEVFHFGWIAMPFSPSTQKLGFRE